MRIETKLACAALLVLAGIALPSRAQVMVQEPSDALAIAERDKWIVSLGDSFSSGEGNPNNMAHLSLGINAWKWMDDDVKCHRSKWGWPYLVATRAAADASVPVYLSFLACSGGSLDKGLLSPFLIGTSTRKAQLDQLEDLVRSAGRIPDVVVMTGGGNDLGFADIVKECITPGNCPGGNHTDLLARRWDALSKQDGLYDQVAGRLAEMGIPADRVVLVGYPNPLKGRLRKVNLEWGPLQVLAACYPPASERQWAWASNNVVEPLQDLQRKVARTHGWRLVDSHLETFERHSYCPRPGGPGAGPWWVGFLPTFVRQFGYTGMFHPNVRGHEAMADAAFGEVRSALLRPRAPSPTSERVEAESSAPPADAVAEDPIVQRQGGTVASCEATVTAATDLRQGAAAPALRPRLPGVMPSGNVVARTPRMPGGPVARNLVAFTHEGGWVVARGNRSFSRNIPDEAYRKLNEFQQSRSVDAIAFAPSGGWTIVAGDAGWTRNVGGNYHDRVQALLRTGKRVRAVAFNPAGWQARRGYVLAYEGGVAAEHVPVEMCAKIRQLAKSGQSLDAVAFTPDGGWTIVADGYAWTRNVGGPSPTYHQYIQERVARGDTVHSVSFNPVQYDARNGWLVLADADFGGRAVPEEAMEQLRGTLGLEGPR